MTTTDDDHEDVHDNVDNVDHSAATMTVTDGVESGPTDLVRRNYTGWTLSTGFGSESTSRCSDVCTRWLLNTCRPTANPSPAFLVVATCDRLTAVIWTSHV